MKKNILFISPTGTLDNGAEISIFHLMKYLVQDGYDVINAIPDYHVQVQQDYISTLAKEGIRTIALPSVKWWWEDAPGGLPGTHEERVNSYQENIAALRKLMVDSHIDLVITNTVNMFQGAVAAACEDIPHFWLIHEFPEGEFGYYKEKIDFVDEYSQEIFAVTGSLQKRLAQLLPHRKIRSFAPFTEIKAEKEQKLAGAECRILSVGRLTERKNQLELLQAYAKLSQPRPELVFIGAWDNEYKNKCDSYIDEHQLENIQFLGYHDNPWTEATTADIAVFPSAMETFGLVYIESIMNGLPTILSDNPGHLSAYEMFEEGQLYPTGNVDELTNQIQQCLENFEYLKKRSLDNIERVKNLYKVSSVYHDILEEIAQSDTNSGHSLRHIKFLFEPRTSLSPISTLLNKVKKKISCFKS